MLSYTADKSTKTEGTGFSSAKHRDGVITNPVFDAFYSTLRQWIYANQKEKDADKEKGEKRAQPDEDMDEAPRPEKKFAFL